MYVFDIESNGIQFSWSDWYRSLETVHCIVITCRKTGKERRYRNNDEENTIAEGVKFLSDATHEGIYIGGHNIHGFDVPALQWLFNEFAPDRNFVRDSLTESELWYPSGDLKNKDFAAMRKYGKDKWIAGKWYGRHNLGAWGERLGCPKDEYKKWCDDNDIADPWGQWSIQMEDYCAQDVTTNIKLFDFLEKKFDYEQAALGVWLENRVAPILQRQEEYGVGFDKKAAVKLVVELTARGEEIATELQEFFPAFYMRDGKLKTPKRSLNYKDKMRPSLTAGCAYTPVKCKDFNPTSRQHIAMRLKKLYNWQPKEFTPTGEPKVDEDVLKTLLYPPVPKLLEYLTVEKRLGQIQNGKTAWFQHDKEGRIHGRVKQNGTRTTRASHCSPNLGQVPKVGKPYGEQCRSLFTAGDGRNIVGCDQSGIELRALGHYLAAYDGGVYAEECISGDVHERAREAIGFNSRDNTKTAEYSFLYGAQNPNLGKTTYDDLTKEQRKELGQMSDKKLSALGASTRRRLQQGIKGLDPLVEAAHKAADRGWVRALDGRKIACPSKHSALNTILQHLGGLLSKIWMVIIDDMLIEAGLNPANRWYIGDEREWGSIQMLWIHDELQNDTKETLEKTVGDIMVKAARLAGEHLHLRVRVDAEYKVGATWAQTH